MTVELSERTSLLVLGVGNILWADEGFGVRCVEAFNATFRPLPGTAILDGGTLGMYLLEPIENTDDLLVFDCADLGEKPGSMRLLDENDIELWTSTKLSAHQGGMNDILAMAALQGKSPKRLAVVAVQPGEAAGLRRITHRCLCKDGFPCGRTRRPETSELGICV